MYNKVYDDDNPFARYLYVQRIGGFSCLNTFLLQARHPFLLDSNLQGFGIFVPNKGVLAVTIKYPEAVKKMF